MSLSKIITAETPSVVRLPETKLHLRGDTVPFVDECGNSLQNVGNVAQGRSILSGSSIAFGGSKKLVLSNPDIANIGTRPFCFEVSYVPSGAVYDRFLTTHIDASGGGYAFFLENSRPGFQFLRAGYTSFRVDLVRGLVVDRQIRTRLAIERTADNLIRFYMNGKLKYSRQFAEANANIISTNSTVNVGAVIPSVDAYNGAVLIDELRFTIGTTIYNGVDYADDNLPL